MRRWVPRGLLLVLSVTGALLGAEGFLRMTGWAPVRGLATVDERLFERIPGLLVPGQSVLAEPDGPFPYRVTVDSLGYRGTRAVERARPPGEFRVLFVGDSFTFGQHVQDDETLPAQVERALAVSCEGARTLNGGFPGFTILGEGHQAIRGMALDPSVVVLVFYENDLFELLHVRIWDQLAINRRLKSRFPLSLVYPAMRSSALWRMTMRATLVPRQRWGARRAGADPEEPGDMGPPWARSWPAARPEYRERLASLSAELEARGAGFLFVAFPSPESAATELPGEDFGWALETARSLGIATLDLHEALREDGLAPEEIYLLPQDYHPSSAGHAWASARVVEAIRDLEAFADRSSGCLPATARSGALEPGTGLAARMEHARPSS